MLNQSWANNGLGQTKKWSEINPEQFLFDLTSLLAVWGYGPAVRPNGSGQFGSGFSIFFVSDQFFWSGPDRYLPNTVDMTYYITVYSLKEASSGRTYLFSVIQDNMNSAFKWLVAKKMIYSKELIPNGELERWL